MVIKSRILKFLNFDVMKDMNKVCQSKRTTDNNEKAKMMLNVLDKHEIDYEQLGAGTNRLAVLIDGYVFKLALDRWGLQDNKNEYTTSKELQPFVAKTYECNENGLVLVGEYVTVLSKDEFNDEAVKNEMRKILGLISWDYLLDDVGVVVKNFMNWGYRDDGQLVILDYAYVYRIEGEEMICGNILDDNNICSTMLEYDGYNFDRIHCPSCKKKFTAMDIRRRIDFEFEKKQNAIARSPEFSYKVTKPETNFNDSKEDMKQINNKNEKGEIDMNGDHKKYNNENVGLDFETIANYGFEDTDSTNSYSNFSENVNKPMCKEENDNTQENIYSEDEERDQYYQNIYSSFEEESEQYADEGLDFETIANYGFDDSYYDDSNNNDFYENEDDIMYGDEEDENYEEVVKEEYDDKEVFEENSNTDNFEENCESVSEEINLSEKEMKEVIENDDIEIEEDDVEDFNEEEQEDEVEDEEESEEQEEKEEDSYKGLIVQKPTDYVDDNIVGQIHEETEEDRDNRRRQELVAELLGDDNNIDYSDYEDLEEEAYQEQIEYKKRQYNNKRGK